MGFIRKKFNKGLSAFCRLTLNHTKSSSLAANVLAAQHEKMLHAANSSMDEDTNGDEQLRASKV